MNLCHKKTYLSREIETIHLTSKQTLLIHFKDTDNSIAEHIELTTMELDQINRTYVNLPKQTDQEKPNGSSTDKDI